jgi:hypothetical protein
MLGFDDDSTRFASDRLRQVAISRNVKVRSKGISPVREEYRGYRGTGSIFKSGFVLTCDHADDLDTDKFVDKKPALVAFKHMDYDLAMLSAETAPNMGELDFSDKYNVFDKVFWCGNPTGTIRDVCYPGYITKVTRSLIYVSTHGMAGPSGGLLWHVATGKPIGVLFERPKGMTKYMNASVVKRFIRLWYESMVQSVPTSHEAVPLVLPHTA